MIKCFGCHTFSFYRIQCIGYRGLRIMCLRPCFFLWLTLRVHIVGWQINKNYFLQDIVAVGTDFGISGANRLQHAAQCRSFSAGNTSSGEGKEDARKSMSLLNRTTLTYRRSNFSGTPMPRSLLSTILYGTQTRTTGPLRSRTACTRQKVATRDAERGVAGVVGFKTTERRRSRDIAIDTQY